MDAILLNNMCRGVCGLSQSFQWCSSVGCKSKSISSGIPVWGSFNYFSSATTVYPASIRWVAQWYPSVHWVNQWHSSGIPVYNGPASVHWLRVKKFTVIIYNHDPKLQRSLRHSWVKVWHLYCTCLVYKSNIRSPGFAKILEQISLNKIETTLLEALSGRGRLQSAVTHLVNKTLINGKDNALIIYEQTDRTLS